MRTTYLAALAFVSLAAGCGGPQQEPAASEPVDTQQDACPPGQEYYDISDEVEPGCYVTCSEDGADDQCPQGMECANYPLAQDPDCEGCSGPMTWLCM